MNFLALLFFCPKQTQYSGLLIPVLCNLPQIRVFSLFSLASVLKGLYVLPEHPIFLRAKCYNNWDYVCGWIIYYSFPVSYYTLITSEEQCREQETKGFFNILEGEGLLHSRGICSCAHWNLFLLLLFLDTQQTTFSRFPLQSHETIMKPDP